jgi:hypothetical protein
MADARTITKLPPLPSMPAKTPMRASYQFTAFPGWTFSDKFPSDSQITRSFVLAR